MSLRISFDLDEDDLKHFRLIMLEARKAAANLAPEDIVGAAEALLAKFGDEKAPGFIVDRLAKLRIMISMITDLEWRLPHDDATRVLNALAYFAEPEDLIPDTIPGLGYLDDAIMIELVVRELKHEIDAYQDFCEFRRAARQDQPQASVSRGDWLDNRREQLQSRMRRRRKRNPQRAGATSRLRLLD